MCKLNFEYEAKNVPEEMKIEFENRANKKYASVCEKINKSNSYVIVNWTGNPERLRGVLIIDDEINKTLKLNNLTGQID
ncbi:hypothetical protein [Mucilaginibacter flavidus]|uniref:hypothetical protein n=1 Tax=Mucilaginibacter flavidus TaxID=2949309 RepID=UPI002092E28D|nr:hypothetical protein [Mucilaginibacter flavidus]MCO5947936.1 hypothetical protein [Mucilaginibacter flavidus]